MKISCPTRPKVSGTKTALNEVYFQIRDFTDATSYMYRYTHIKTFIQLIDIFQLTHTHTYNQLIIYYIYNNLQIDLPTKLNKQIQIHLNIDILPLPAVLSV